MLRAAVLVLGLALSGCVLYLNPLCTDQIKNGEETDIDCGGVCGKCEIGASCSVDADCEDSDCKGGTCTAFPCFNGVRDGNETDVDCGGGCRRCAGLRDCLVDTDCASGTCTAAKTCSGFATVAFDSATYDAGEKPYVALTADFDGDGRTDVIAADELGDQLYLFHGTALGPFQAPATFSLRETGKFPTGVYPTGGAVADMNGDGRPDVVTANYHGNAVSVLTNSATIGFGPPASTPTRDGAETSNLAVGDLDGDGRIDVVATNPQTSSISVLLGNGNGTLAPAVDLPVGITGAAEPYSVAVGNFDHDGRPDVAIADSRSATVIVRLGNGDGTFQPEVAYPLGGTAPFIIIAADLDGDGELDLASANRGSDNVSVLLGRGDGTFKKPRVASTGMMSGPYSIATADFNRDGVADLVTGDFASTATFSGNDASVLLGIGDGTYEPPILVPGTPAYGVATGDFNGDGKPDFAAVNFTFKTMTVQISTAH